MPCASCSFPFTSGTLCNCPSYSWWESHICQSPMYYFPILTKASLAFCSHSLQRQTPQQGYSCAPHSCSHTPTFPTLLPLPPSRCDRHPGVSLTPACRVLQQLVPFRSLLYTYLQSTMLLFLHSNHPPCTFFLFQFPDFS